jgi:hypothetical protein
VHSRIIQLREGREEYKKMGHPEDNITRTEKYKIAGIIGVAVFVVSMMIWSSLEIQIQQLLNWLTENGKIVITEIYDLLTIK